MMDINPWIIYVALIYINLTVGRYKQSQNA